MVIIGRARQSPWAAPSTAGTTQTIDIEEEPGDSYTFSNVSSTSFDDNRDEGGSPSFPGLSNPGLMRSQ